MRAVEIASDTYQKCFPDHLVVFESLAFNELNAHKCKQVLYLAVMDEDKYRFGVIAGLRDDGKLKAPFSAPFTLFSRVKKNNKVGDYHEAVQAIVNYCRSRDDFREICFTLPPCLYAETCVSNLANAFYVNRFTLEKLDLNFHFDLSSFSDKYIEEIDIKARQKLRASFKAGLTFEKIGPGVDAHEAYAIIKNNRVSKGYPLHMSYEDVVKTMGVIDVDFFIVRDSTQKGVASAMVFHVATGIVQVIYWGNIDGSDELKPMNFLSYKVFEYYKEKKMQVVDIGPSTDNSIPNFGLCDFKQGIGCVTSAKYSFSLKL